LITIQFSFDQHSQCGATEPIITSTIIESESCEILTWDARYLLNIVFIEYRKIDNTIIRIYIIIRLRFFLSIKMWHIIEWLKEGTRGIIKKYIWKQVWNIFSIRYKILMHLLTAIVHSLNDFSYLLFIKTNPHNYK